MAVKGEVAADGVPHGDLLVAFTEGVLADNSQMESIRLQVIDKLGDAAFVDVCATVASFNAVVKVADGTGIPLEPEKEARTQAVREQLGLDVAVHSTPVAPA